MDHNADITRVDDRRHGSTCQFPDDWSITTLIESVISFAANIGKLTTLDPIKDVPSQQWVRMSFSPHNPWFATSANYTCRFDMSYGSTSRNAKADHPHAAYAARFFKAWKYKACQWKEKLKPHKLEVREGFLDDKTSFKIAEPAEAGGEAVAPLERNKKTPVAGGQAAQAGHHTFTWAKGNPSMALITDIPDDPTDSFYRGQVYGVVADQVWKPSSASRHSAHYFKMLEDSLQAVGGMARLSINFIFTDGGPDHNLTFLTVQLALICLHLATGADATITGRPAAHNSWVIVASRRSCAFATSGCTDARW